MNSSSCLTPIKTEWLTRLISKLASNICRPICLKMTSSSCWNRLERSLLIWFSLGSTSWKDECLFEKVYSIIKLEGGLWRNGWGEFFCGRGLPSCIFCTGAIRIFIVCCFLKVFRKIFSKLLTSSARTQFSRPSTFYCCYWKTQKWTLFLCFWSEKLLN